MVLVNTITEDEDCENLEQHFKNRLLFGGIFVGFPYHMKSLEELALKEYNVTFVDQWSEEEKIFQSTKNVNCNDRDGAKQAVRYLIQHGHREIAFLQGDNRLSAIARLQGYQDAMHADRQHPCQRHAPGTGAQDTDLPFRHVRLPPYPPTPGGWAMPAAPAGVFVAEKMSFPCAC